MTPPDRPSVPAPARDATHKSAQAGATAGTDVAVTDLNVPDEEQIARLREAVQRDRTALDRIGLGLRALHNHPLFEGLPDDFRGLIEQLQRCEGRDPAPE